MINLLLKKTLIINMGINDKLKNRKTGKQLKEAAKELTPPVEEKKPFDKKEYDKKYSKKKVTVKLNKASHTKAVEQSKKRFMTISKYLEYLINEDGKNFPT